jgi:hypothetical protein
MNETDYLVLSKMVSLHYRKLKKQKVKVPSSRMQEIVESIQVPESYNENIIIPPMKMGFLKRLLVAFLTLFSWIPSIKKKRDNLIPKSQIKVMQKTRLIDKKITKKIEIRTETTVEQEIPNPRRVLAVGCGQFNFNAYKTEFGTFLTGPDNISIKKNILIPFVPNSEEIVNDDKNLRNSLKQIPWIMDGKSTSFTIKPGINHDDEVQLRGLEKDIGYYFLKFNNSLIHLQKIGLDVSVIQDKEVLEKIRWINSKESSPSDWLKKLSEFYSGPTGESFDSFCSNWPDYWGVVNNILHQVRKDSLIKDLAPDCLDMGNYIDYSAFNFYCPTCNENVQKELLGRNYSIDSGRNTDPISFPKNTRCVYDPLRGNWKCLTCETVTKNPIPMHKILDEILLPTYDRLMEENKVERVKAHNNAREKEVEIKYALDRNLAQIEKEFRNDRDSLRGEIERVNCEIIGEKSTLESMREILKVYNTEETEVMYSIRKFAERVSEEISRRKQTVINEMDQVYSREMAAYKNKMNYISMIKKIEDERRDRVQMAILAANVEQVHQQQMLNQKMAQQVNLQKESNQIASSGFAQTNSNLRSIESGQQRGNAILSAQARGMGIDAVGVNPLLPWQWPKAIDQGCAELSGRLLGKSAADIESDRM